ncbi:DUF2242 domain-containing protein [Luteimonas yindakuii]|uniref:DUF2242 domain-containing protein n=1 Tax=Luteimonas yindakuii TaxID=2565782 RepID=A0A4Z1RFJ9_9GAMM|nr:DUF2242 domain-containing protein [Luteimonas yindakuii]TKS54953.1 DUF2242 domain-containing protein [Luteimonas yindakuii]
MPASLPRVVLFACLVASLLAACGGGQAGKARPALLGETFAFDDMYSRTFATRPDVACEAARRALLGQGYAVGRAEAASVEASKNFQPESDSHLQLAVRVSCVPQDGHALVFVSALQDRYALRRSANSASLGVSALGSVSLPIGSTEDSLVRVASSTVQDAEFYSRFFERLGHYLPAHVREVEDER